MAKARPYKTSGRAARIRPARMTTLSTSLNRLPAVAPPAAAPRLGTVQPLRPSPTVTPPTFPMPGTLRPISGAVRRIPL